VSEFGFEVAKVVIAGSTAIAAGCAACFALWNWRVANTNAVNAARWKRAELASSYLIPLFEDPELGFALRCLDWGGGVIPIPEHHLAMFPPEQKTIEHNPALVAQAMEPSLRPDISRNPQGMLYRLALDALFTRFEWIGYRVSNGLIEIEDVPDLEYWMRLLADWPYAPTLEKHVVFLTFLQAAGYVQTLELMRRFGVIKLPAPDRIAASAEFSVALRESLERNPGRPGKSKKILVL
jgi:hypothetical protein